VGTVSAGNFSGWVISSTDFLEKSGRIECWRLQCGKIRARKDLLLVRGSGVRDLTIGSVVETRWRDSACAMMGVDINATELFLELVPVGRVSVTESVLEKRLFALVDILEHQPLAKVTLGGIDDPLLDMLYRLGKILPRPIAQSMRLCVLLASLPVPKTKKAM